MKRISPALFAMVLALACPIAGYAQLSLLGGGGSLLGGGSVIGSGSLLGGSGTSLLPGVNLGGVLDGVNKSLLGGTLGAGPLQLGTSNLLGPLDLGGTSILTPLGRLNLGSVGASDATNLISRLGTYFPGAATTQFPYAPDGTLLLDRGRSAVFSVYSLGDLGGSYSSRLYGHDPYSTTLNPSAAVIPPLKAETSLPLKLQDK